MSFWKTTLKRQETESHKEAEMAKVVEMQRNMVPRQGMAFREASAVLADIFEAMKTKDFSSNQKASQWNVHCILYFVQHFVFVFTILGPVQCGDERVFLMESGDKRRKLIPTP